MPDEQAKEDAAGEELVLISARVRKVTRKRARVFCAEQDVSMQELIDRALNEYVDRHSA
ncbi:ribbon-helix-helix protein [Streptomyces sp. NPDC002073]